MSRSLVALLLAIAVLFAASAVAQDQDCASCGNGCCWKTVTFQGSPLPVAFDAIVNGTKSGGPNGFYELVAEDSAAGTIQATYTTPQFGFVDDLYFECAEAAEGSACKSFSKSRLGTCDFGQNELNLEMILDFTNLAYVEEPICGCGTTSCGDDFPKP